MKTKTYLTGKHGLLVTLALLGGSCLASAADRYNFTFSVSGKTTNALGELVSVSLNRSRVLSAISDGSGIPTSQLALIYDRPSGQILVVDREFGTNVAVVAQFQSEVSVASADGKLTQTYIDVTDPLDANVSGKGVGTVRIGRNSLGQETSFKVSGKVFMAIEEDGDDTTQVYSGTFSTSSVFTPRQITN